MCIADGYLFERKTPTEGKSSNRGRFLYHIVFSKFGGGCAHFFFKGITEVEQIVKAESIGNFGYRIARFGQESLGFLHSERLIITV